MHALHDRIRGDDDVLASRFQDRGVVDEAERARIDRERLEVAGDQGVFAGWARAIGHASALVATSGMSAAGKFLSAELPCDLVEHGVDHAGLLTLDKGVRDIDIFRYHDPARHVPAMF